MHLFTISWAKRASQCKGEVLRYFIFGAHPPWIFEDLLKKKDKGRCQKHPEGGGGPSNLRPKAAKP